MKNLSVGTIFNRKEGTYTFKLKAQGVTGGWCRPIAYTFRVLPPWYRTWWAYMAYVLLLIAAFQLFSNLSERKLMAENEKPERTVVVEKQKNELVQKNMLVGIQKTVIEIEKQRSDDLLLNILPGEVAEDIVSAGLEIREYIQTRIEEKTAAGKEPFLIRIGVHTGPVVAGIGGSKKFAYDIWGIP